MLTRTHRVRALLLEQAEAVSGKRDGAAGSSVLLQHRRGRRRFEQDGRSGGAASCAIPSVGAGALSTVPRKPGDPGSTKHSRLCRRADNPALS